nr:curved dna-binding protein [Quercus suber]
MAFLSSTSKSLISSQRLDRHFIRSGMRLTLPKGIAHEYQRWQDKNLSSTKINRICFSPARSGQDCLKSAQCIFEIVSTNRPGTTEFLNYVNSTVTMAETTPVDYSLANPDTLTKYKTASQISQNVLSAVSKLCSEGSKIVEICQKGDKLLEDEVAKVYKGKKIAKGISHPCTVSPSIYVTPYTPLTSDAEEAETVLKSGEAVKIQLGAHIDGFGAIVCDTVLVSPKQDDTISGRSADLLLATHYANELLLRLMVPPGLAVLGTEEEKKKAQAQKPYSQSKMTQLLEKVVKSYDCNLVENTTCWVFERNEIEGKKKIILAPGEGVKGEGLAEVGEVWGVEIGVSIGTGKVKSLPNRPTLHRRTTTTYGLKRPSSRATLSEVQKKFGTFPFSLRQLEDERAGKVGIVECVRGGVVRQYEVIGSNDGEPVSRLFTTIAITKNGLQRLAAPPTPNLDLLKSDKKITDEEVLKILELPLAKPFITQVRYPNSADIQFGRHSEMAARTAGLRTRRDQRTFPQDPEPSRTAQSSGVAPKDEAMRKRTVMEQWLEPTVRKQSSYQDHGGAPYGVLEHMQPLGELPNSKVKARVKVDGARKTVMGRSVVAAGQEAQETPEGTPVPPSMPAHSARVVRSPAHMPGTIHNQIVLDDDKDGDYAPGAKKQERGVKSRASKPRRSEGAVVPRSATNETRRYSTPTIADLSLSQQKLRRIVEEAKRRAIEVGKPDLAGAVHEIWLQSLHDGRLTQVLQDILAQRATADQTSEFQNYVKEAKVRLKEKSRNHNREQPAIVVNTGEPQPPRSAPQLATPSSNIEASSSKAPSNEPAVLPKPRLSLKVRSPHPKIHHPHPAGTMSISPTKKAGNADASDSDLTEFFSEEEDVIEMNQASIPRNKRPVVNGNSSHQSSISRPNLAASDRGVKRSSAEAQVADDERDFELTIKKRKLERSVTRDYEVQESNIRDPPKEPVKTFRLGRPRNESILSPLAVPDRNTDLGMSRAASVDHESPLSELGSPLPSPGPDEIPAGPKVKKAKTKTSPEKKQLGPHAAWSSQGGGVWQRQVGVDETEELSDNNDFCSACRGSGFLLCCDGCDRAFHFQCLDPPLGEEASALNEPWYCFQCHARNLNHPESPQKVVRGIFAPLLSSIKKTNPSAYCLPLEIREYFEGVDTDKDGTFMSGVRPRVRRGGYDEMSPDYTRTKDEKGNSIICHSCHKSSANSRQLITCDTCGTHWHLDCLDPPLAKTPARILENKRVQTWLCPLHVDHELREVDTSLLNVRRRKIHIRRPKRACVKDTALTRGFRNNGIIEVLEESSDGSESEFYDEGASDEDESTIHRLPAAGIKLDFIDKVKVYVHKPSYIHQFTLLTPCSARQRRHEQYAVQQPSMQPVLNTSVLEQANFAKRSFSEKQMALNLTQFASANQDLELGKDQVENLAEAPSNVVDEYLAAEDAEKAHSSTSGIPPSPPASEQPEQLSDAQRNELLMLQELIRRRLEGGKT